MRHVFLGFLALGVVILAFHQRFENGAADPVVMFFTIPSMLYLMFNSGHVMMGFSYIKHRKYLRGKG